MALSSPSFFAGLLHIPITRTMAISPPQPQSPALFLSLSAFFRSSIWAWVKVVRQCGQMIASTEHGSRHAGHGCSPDFAFFGIPPSLPSIFTKAPNDAPNDEHFAIDGRFRTHRRIVALDLVAAVRIRPDPLHHSDFRNRDRPDLVLLIDPLSPQVHDDDRAMVDRRLHRGAAYPREGQHFRRRSEERRV